MLPKDGENQHAPEKPSAEPEKLPPAFTIRHIPHPRNPNFTGRDELLKSLREALCSGQAAALTAIHGMGGVGKTQLALEYCYRHQEEYRPIWWLRAEEPATLAADYAALAAELDLPQKDQTDQNVVIAAVRRWLTQNPGWLLVFDNARAAASLEEYIPNGASGHVIITSRNPEWEAVAKPLEVPRLERPEAVEFLLKRTGQADRASAEALAKELGDLPLALEQAGAYMKATGTSLAGYLELFRDHHQRLLREGKPPVGYDYNVATTWEVAFQEVQKESPAAAGLLNLCAFLAPDDIPRSLISEGAKEHLPEPLASVAADPIDFGTALGTLRKYALIDLTDEALSVHRLVQLVTRDRLAPNKWWTWICMLVRILTRDRLVADVQRKWAGTAVILVKGAFPFKEDDPRSWPGCARLLPHGLEAAGHAENLRVAPKTTGRLLNQLGLYLQVLARFAQARACFERALRIGEKVYDPDHPQVAIYVNNLGLVLQDLGELPEARKHLKRALEIAEKADVPDYAVVAKRLNNLGGVLREQGDLTEARACYERALRIAEKVYILNPDHPEVAIYVNNLGTVLQDLRDLMGAKACYKRALGIDEKVYGPDHPTVAIRVNNLGGVLKEQGDLPEAKACFERALKIGEKVYGPDHPNVATYVNNLGGVLQDLGELPEAKACFERALRIDEKVYGPDHPNVAKRLNNLGTFLKDLGDLPGARAHFERAREICKKFLGENHPKTLLVQSNLDTLDEAIANAPDQ
ncbi:MAG: FxSxx-COOH system tetratricopeptide repeat protein [Pseudomonadota bacterium]